MQYINLNKTIKLENKISDLLLISIDDKIETNEDKDGIKIVGNIAIGGKVKTLEGEEDFDDSINIDIFLMYEEIIERNALNVSVDDFSYEIKDNSLLLNVVLKIDGLKEIETTFLAKEDNEFIQEDINGEEIEKVKLQEAAEDIELEIKEDKKVYIDIDIDVNDRNDKKEVINELVEGAINEMEELATQEEIGIEKQKDNEINLEIKKKSLLKSVFSNKKIHEEVSWKLHCVKNESSYEEIANKYNVSLNKLISINNNEKIEEGKLIFLPLD